MRPCDNPSFEGTDPLARVIVGSLVSNRLRNVGSAESSKGGFCGSSSSRGRSCGRYVLGSRPGCERRARVRPDRGRASELRLDVTPLRAVRGRRLVLHAEEQRVRERHGRLDVVRRSRGRRGQRALVRERFGPQRAGSAAGRERDELAGADQPARPVFPLVCPWFHRRRCAARADPVPGSDREPDRGSQRQRPITVGLRELGPERRCCSRCLRSRSGRRRRRSS